jgi:hypothetical protein
MKKIIVYSIFGQEEFYRKGLIDNLKIIDVMFPDFVTRIYADATLPADFVRTLEGPNVEIVIKKSEYPYHGLLWRFLPLLEPEVFSVIRDCDQRLTERDRWMYDDFHSTGRNYFVIRDLPGCKSPLMAGGWGFQGIKEGVQVVKLWDEWRKSQKLLPGGYLWDQGFLGKKIYPKIRHQLTTYTDHVLYEGESDIRRIPIGRLVDREISEKLTYNSSDIAESDDVLSISAHGNGNLSMNAYRREFIKEAKNLFNVIKPWEDPVKNKSYMVSHDLNFLSNRVEILYPRNRHENKFINEILFYCDVLIKVAARDDRVISCVKHKLKRIISFGIFFKNMEAPKYPYR